MPGFPIDPAALTFAESHDELDGGHLLLAFVDGVRAGYARRERYGREVYLSGIAVAADFQRMGIGRALVDEFVRRYGTPGRSIVVASARENTREGNRLIAAVNRDAGFKLLRGVDMGYDGRRS